MAVSGGSTVPSMLYFIDSCPWNCSMWRRSFWEVIKIWKGVPLLMTRHLWTMSWILQAWWKVLVSYNVDSNRHFPLTLSLPESILESITVVIPFESVDETLVCDHSNESYSAVLSCGAVCFWQFSKMKFKIFSSVFELSTHSSKLSSPFSFSLLFSVDSDEDDEEEESHSSREVLCFPFFSPLV